MARSWRAFDLYTNKNNSSISAIAFRCDIDVGVSKQPFAVVGHKYQELHIVHTLQTAYSCMKTTWCSY